MNKDITEVIEKTLRPLIQRDGGDIQLLSYNAPNVLLKLSGEFIGCPGTGMVLEGIITPALRNACGKEIQVKLA